MTTGDPHPLAFGPWIDHDMWPTGLHLRCPGLVISISDRVISGQVRDRLIVWDWRTGAKIIVSITILHPRLS